MSYQKEKVIDLTKDDDDAKVMVLERQLVLLDLLCIAATLTRYHLLLNLLGILLLLMSRLTASLTFLVILVLCFCSYLPLMCSTFVGTFFGCSKRKHYVKVFSA